MAGNWSGVMSSIKTDGWIQPSGIMNKGSSVTMKTNGINRKTRIAGTGS